MASSSDAATDLVSLDEMRRIGANTTTHLYTIFAILDDELYEMEFTGTASGCIDAMEAVGIDPLHDKWARGFLSYNHVPIVTGDGELKEFIVAKLTPFRKAANPAQVDSLPRADQPKRRSRGSRGGKYKATSR